MCGRYVLHADIEELVEQFKLKLIEAQVQPRYNIAPSQDIAAIVETDQGRVLKPLRWGLVPHWAQDVSIGNKMINARAETVAEKPSFRSLVKSHRCVIPASGFYEWKAEAGKKAPYYIHRQDDEPFGFAGLWTEWKEKGSEAPPLKTCTIITTAANELMESIHHRMPVILPPEACDEWLNPDNEDTRELAELLVPYAKGNLEAYRVSAAVSSPRNQGEELIEPAKAETVVAKPQLMLDLDDSS